MENILELRDVCKDYHSFSLKNVNISLPKGSIMGFIGENGAGKSTTIKLILNLVWKNSGEIKVFDCDHEKLNREMKEHIGVVLDECHYPQELNWKDINSIMKRFYKTWDGLKFEGYMKRFKIDKACKVKEYSRGMKMKLSIAVAISHDSKLLILDEATSGLDPIVREQILDLLMEFIQDEEKSVFLSSHILSDLEKICDYITFIHRGEIVLSENKDDLLGQYAVLHCSETQLSQVDNKAIIAVQKNAFGVDALVYRDKVSTKFTMDPANLEQIMLFITKKGAA